MALTRSMPSGARFRFVNRLEVWIELQDQRIVDAGQSGGGCINVTKVRYGPASIAFMPVPCRTCGPTRRSAQPGSLCPHRGGGTGFPAPRRSAIRLTCRSRRGSDPAAVGQCNRQSRALAGGLTAEPSWVPSAACAAHSNTVRRPSGVVGPRTSGCPPCLGRPAPVLGQHPRVQCPASGVCASGVRASSVRCPLRASGIRVHVVRTSEFVERVDAAGSHTSQDRPGRVTT
jgi:hypothetical protein